MADIDYINRTLTVNRQLGRKPNTKKSDVEARTYTKQEIPPKTKSSRRTLNIPDYVFEEILKERKKYEKNKSRRKRISMIRIISVVPALDIQEVPAFAISHISSF